MITNCFLQRHLQNTWLNLTFQNLFSSYNHIVNLHSLKRKFKIVLKLSEKCYYYLSAILLSDNVMNSDRKNCRAKLLKISFSNNFKVVR